MHAQTLLFFSAVLPKWRTQPPVLSVWASSACSQMTKMVRLHSEPSAAPVPPLLAGCEQQPCCSLPVHVLNACTRCMQMQRCLQALVLAVPHAVADEGHGTLIPQGLAALQPHASRPEHLVTKA